MSLDDTRKAYYYYLNSPRKDLYICKIAEYYYEQGKTVFILVDSTGRAETLDAELWSFKQSSFVPHEVIDEYSHSPQAPVVISSSRGHFGVYEVLIVASEITEKDGHFLGQFAVIVDFADQWDEILLSESRNRYQVIKKLGYTMHTVEKIPF